MCGTPGDLEKRQSLPDLMCVHIVHNNICIWLVYLDIDYASVTYLKFTTCPLDLSPSNLENTKQKQ